MNGKHEKWKFDYEIFINHIDIKENNTISEEVYAFTCGSQYIFPKSKIYLDFFALYFIKTFFI